MRREALVVIRKGKVQKEIRGVNLATERDRRV